MPALSRSPRYLVRRHRLQAGYSLVEFSAVAIPLLMAGLGSIELAHWFFVKQAVSLALLEAARAGITQHAAPQAMEAAFEKALLPLHPASQGQSAEQKLQSALRKRTQAVDGPAWRIEVLQPGPAAFADFGGTRLPISARHGLAAIDNHYQAEQHQRHLELGWPQGRGPASGLDIYEANTLALRLTYLHEPALPGLKGLIRQLVSGTDSYSARAMSRAGYLPMRQEIRLTMQTHALQWPASASGKISGRAVSAPPAAPATEPCAGIWCLRTGGQAPGTDASATAPQGGAPGSPDTAGPPHGHESPAPGSTPQAGPQPDASGDATTPQAGNPECGVTLCCLP